MQVGRSKARPKNGWPVSPGQCAFDLWRTAKTVRLSVKLQCGLRVVQKKPPKGGWLASALTRREQRDFGRLYVQHQGLIRLLGSKLTRQFPSVDVLDVFSCIDVAFLKSCRAFDPSKGKFSTIFTRFASGEVRHFIRDHNWLIKAPVAMQERSRTAQQLLSCGNSLEHTAQLMGLKPSDITEALRATTAVVHEVSDWEHHECQAATPMERLEAEEAWQARAPLQP